MLLGAAPGEEVRASPAAVRAGAVEHPGGLTDAVGAYPGDLLGSFGPPHAGRGERFINTANPGLQIVGVRRAIGEHGVQDRQQ